MTYRTILSLQFACSQMIVFCIETFILCKSVIFCRKILTALRTGRPIEKLMQFIVAKCHSMRVTQHYSHKHIFHDYTLHSANLRKRSVRKISWHNNHRLTENMDWGQYISDISSKATKTLGVLRRNLAFGPRRTNEVAYKILEAPKLEQGSS